MLQPLMRMPDTTDPLSEAREILKQYWGYDEFRPAQQEILPDILDGKDVLAVMPTGGGKSVLFQVPAVLERGSTLVISPLIALMKDQVDDCVSRGIPASFVNSHVDLEEAEKRFENWIAGEYRLFYIAPERIRVRSFQTALQRADVSRLAVDEAHCASQWGHDFRPTYACIHEVVEAIEKYSGKRPPILAVTATATWEIEGHIAAALGMNQGYTRYVANPLRPNLSYEVFDRGNSWTTFRKLLPELIGMGGRHVVYASTRAGSGELAEIVKDATGVEAGVYHAGVEQQGRTDVQEAFKDGRLSVVVATSAFGMGIDVPDIRSVVHLGMPDSLESYTQQAGRAGRDGKPSRCVLICDDRALSLQHFFFDGMNPPYQIYQDVWKWLHGMLPDDVQVLRMTAKSIVDAVGRRASDTQITTVLSNLEAHGLIERVYEAESTPITLYVQALRDAHKGAKKDRVRDVISALGRVLELVPKDTRPKVSGFIDKANVAKRAKITTPVLNTTLKQLAESGAIRLGETYIGKSTRFLKRGVALSEHLPQDEIEQKRARAKRRLDAMIGYTLTRTAAQRQAYVRQYFMGDDQ